MIFHANGTGGRTMEGLIAQGAIDAVLDLTITELADELCGGFLSAGPKRLEAAGEFGIPQVVLPGAIDMVNFTTPDTVPERYRHRQLHAHSPNTTLMRTTSEENATLGRWVGEKLPVQSDERCLSCPCGDFPNTIEKAACFMNPTATAHLSTRRVTGVERACGHLANGR